MKTGIIIISKQEKRDREIAEECGISYDEYLETIAQVKENAEQDWNQVKKVLDAMDFYDLIIWWYELEMKKSWNEFHISNADKRERLEKKCAHHVGIYGRAVDHRLKLNSLYKSSHTTVKEILKQMCMMKGNALVNGVLLAKGIGQCLFNTYDIRVLGKVRKEVLLRFIQNRADVAESKNQPITELR